jgi:RNA polymerase sigma factor (sigma-70 family)
MIFNSKSTSSHPQIDEPTAKIVRTCVVRAVQTGMAHANDQDDLVQRILIVLMRRMDSFDSHRASWSTFVRVVTQRELRVALRRSNPTIRVVDCSEVQFEQIESKEIMWLSTELSEAVQVAMGQLPDELRQLCESFLQDPDIRSVSTHFSMSRTTLYRRFASMRRVFRDSSMHEYL